MPALMALLAGVLGLASCGATDESDASGEPPVEAASNEVSLDRAAITEREEVWRAARPAAYRYEVRTECECPRAGSYTVTVVGEEVISIEPQDPDAEPFLLHPAPTLDGAFATLDEPLALAAGGEISEVSASAAFDPSYGHPVSWTVAGSDDLPSHHVEIRNFTPLDPAAIDRPPPGLELVISNQSFTEPDVHLTLTIDGDVVVDRSFAVEGQHNFVSYLIPIEPGDHQLAVRSDTDATHERVITLGPERLHMYIGHWGDDPAGAEEFSVTESDQPIGFG